MRSAAWSPGPVGHTPPFFDDVHSYLRNLMGELSRVRECLDANEVANQQMCDDLRKDIGHECHEAREAMNKFRYEFDELVHRRVETIVEGLEEIEQSQRFIENHRHAQIQTLDKEVRTLISGLSSLNPPWQNFKRNSQNREQLVAERLRQTEQQAAAPRLSPKAEQKRRSSLALVEEVRRSDQKRAGGSLLGTSEATRQTEQQAASPKAESKRRSSLALVEEVRQLDQKRAGGALLGTFDATEQQAAAPGLSPKADPKRRGSLVEEIRRLDQKKADDALFSAFEVARLRLRGAAESVRGDGWHRFIRDQDVDGSGQISFQEFRTLCRTTLKMQEPEHALHVLFDSLDIDGSGEISLEELIEFVTDPAQRMRLRMKRAVRESGVSLHRLVLNHDLDKSGAISFKEFRNMCSNQLKMFDTDVQLQAVFRSIDADHSGEVSAQDLIAWVEGVR